MNHRLLALLAASTMAAWAESPPLAAVPKYESRSIEGWSVQVRAELLANQRDTAEQALALLARQLAEIVRVVPAPATARLREVTLWFSPEYPDVSPRAEYHPHPRWLAAHGRDPAMAKGVEFTNTRIFAREMERMPNFALHELAHAYHDRVLGFDHAGIKAAYENAKAAGIYEKVERWHALDRPTTREQAYGISDDREYFAESTEALFARNDFFPFNRDELAAHDPVMFQLLVRLWGGPS